MTPQQTPLTLPIPSWYRDHCFNDRIILPAVEAMELLATIVKAHYPDMDYRTIQRIRFLRFLELDNREEIDIILETALEEDGSVRAALLSRQQLKAITRVTTHCTGYFSLPFPGHPEEQQTVESEPARDIAAEQVYRELVPFGPAYHTLQGTLHLRTHTASGRLLAPKPLHSAHKDAVFGSPFPLDGAMHLACVHGQRLVDFIPFPVALDERRVYQPTRPGKGYHAQVSLRLQTDDELVYDIDIRDEEQLLRESIKGLTMRDVSSGRIKPPTWIKD